MKQLRTVIAILAGSFLVLLVALAFFFGIFTSAKVESNSTVTPIAPTVVEVASTSVETATPVEPSAAAFAVTATPEPTPTPEPEPEITQNDPIIDGPRIILTGIVTNPQDEPVAGATVKADAGFFALMTNSEKLASVDYSTTTNAKGQYRLVTPASTFASFLAYGEGYGTESRTLQLMNRELNDDTVIKETVNFKLPIEATLDVLVVNELDAPLEGAEVKALKIVEQQISQSEFQLPSIDGVAKTDSFGKLHFTHLNGERDYKISATYAGYVPQEVLAKSPYAPVKLIMKKGGAEISGEVVEQGTEKPISGAVVKVVVVQMSGNGLSSIPTTQETTTDAKGLFHVKNLQGGNFGIFVTHPDFKPSTTQDYSDTLKSNDKRTDIKIFLNKGFTVYGTVTKFETKEPIPGVVISPNRQMVQLMGGGDEVPTATTDASGKYELRGVTVAGGNIYISAKLEGWGLIETNPYGGMPDSMLVSVDESLTSVQHDFQMGQMTTVSGKVKNPTMIGVPNIQVRFIEHNNWSGQTDNTVTTDANGMYTLDVKPNASGCVVAVVDENEVPSEAISMSTEPMKNVDIVIEKYTEIRGLVVDPDDKPIEGAEVKFYQLMPMGNNSFRHGNEKNVTSKADGTFTVTNVYPIRTTAIANHANFAQSESKEVILVPGEKFAEVKLKLRKGQELAGTLLGPEGEPIAGAGMNIYGENGSYNSNEQVTTDEKGYFYFENIPVKEVTVNVWNSAYGSESFPGIKTGDLHLELRMKKKTNYTLIITAKDAKTGEQILDFKAKSPWNPQYHPVTEGVLLLEEQEENMSVQLSFSAEGYSTLRKDYIIQKSLDPDGDMIIQEEVELSKGVELSGVVMDEATKKPIPGVRVEFYGVNLQDWEIQQNYNNTIKTTTDKQGRYTFQNLGLGKNAIRYSAGNEYASRLEDMVVTDETKELETVFLNSGATLKLTLLYSKNQQPAAKIAVSQYSSSGVSKNYVSNEKGLIEIPNLSPEQTAISFPADKFSISVEIKPADKVVEKTVMIGNATITGKIISKGESVGGNIYMYKSDSSGGSISYNQVRISDGDSFTFTKVPPGKWTIKAYPPNWGNELATDEIEVLESSETIEHDLIVPSGTIKGAILLSDGSRYEHDSSTPENQALVTWTRTNAEEISNDISSTTIGINQDGTYEFENLKSGTYNLRAEVPGIGVGTAEVTLTQTEETKVRDITLRTGGATLISTALSFETGQPIDSASMNVIGVSDSSYSKMFYDNDKDGETKGEFIPAGDYIIEVSGWEKSVSHRELTLKEGETKRIEDVLYNAGGILWTVKTNAAGTANYWKIIPLDNAGIERERTGGFDEGTQNPTATQYGLIPGKYRCEALTGNGTLLVTKDVEVVANQATTVESVVP